MKTDTYYRLQSKAYEVGPDSISWYMSFSTIEDAMEQDILELWKSIDDQEFYHKQFQKLEDGVPVKEIWKEFKDAGYKPKWVEPGLSCFSNIGDLFVYWNIIGYPEAFIEELYLLMFEGEFINKGSNNEDCVRFIKEVERIDLENFLPVIELLEVLGYKVDKFISDNGFYGIDDLIFAANDYLANYKEGRLDDYDLEQGFLDALKDD